MNWRRGLLRLWVVGTALFVIAVTSISYSGIKSEFDLKSSVPPNIVAQPAAQQPNKSLSQWSDEELWAVIALANPWEKVAVTAAIAFGIPLVVLALGASLGWAFSGFATRRPT